MQDPQASQDDEFFDVSKSQRKREMHALQRLGEQLTEVSDERLQSLDLPDTLLEALRTLKSIKAHGAIRRQLQYIGRLMRDIDPTPIETALEKWSGHSRAEVAKQHLAERWREELLADDTHLTRWISEHPGTDIQSLRTLIRQCKKEALESKPPRAYREIYQLVFHALDEATP